MTVDECTRKQVCNGGGGIFHKMDRDEASSQHSSSGTEEIFMAKHNMPFWSAQRDSRQRQAIRLPDIQIFLPSDGGRSSFCIIISRSVQRSSGKSECIDIHSHKEDTRESVERQMGRRIAESSMEPQYFHLQSYKIHPLKLLYGEEPVTPEEIKLPSTRTKTQAMYRLSEAKCKDLLELERMKAVKNLQSYQSEIRAWRDKKVKLKHIEPGHLVLL
jgi:hypothetical protein